MAAAAEPTIALDRTITDPIGVGSFGTVYKVKWGDKTVAVKIINLHQIRHSPKFEKYRNVETNELVPFAKALRHPNIVAILACDRTHFPEVWLVLELCDCGLDKYLKEHDLSHEETIYVVEQATTGLAFLHANNVIHRDVKPNNFLVLRHDSGVQIKVTDYSLCKDVDSLPGSTMTTVHGNKHWMAPELFSEDEHSATEVTYKRSIDVFSLALVIMYVCMDSAGRKLLEKIYCGAVVKAGEDLLEKFKKHWRLDSLREPFYPLLTKMLELDPDKRPTMEEVVKDIRVALVPEVVTTCPSLRHLISCNLLFKGDWNVGIGGDNYVLVGDRDTSMLHLLQLHQQQDNTVQYRKVWSKPGQSSARVYSRKCVIDQTIITEVESSITCHNLDLSPLHNHVGKVGVRLVNVISPHTMVYSERIEEGQYKLSLYDGDTNITLQPPRGTHWYFNSSICRHPTTGWMAASNSNGLAIYDRTGKLRHHVKLKYIPDSIDCTNSHIFIAKFHYGVPTTNLHVVSWSGVEVGIWDLKTLLKLSEEENSLVMIGICQNNVLHAVVGGFKNYLYNVTSLHAFHIK